ncbi:MAG TPA: nitrite reductase small subunit NirD [Roseateles sp.]|uniref:nitrite reductase small subunit NirD n=1 Tax=Roseateles sp. TaxID=1971397 RepID=UPI002ED842FE
MSWTRICALQDIPVLGSRRVQRAAGVDVALFRTADDEVFALLDHCPHKGGPLSQGIVFGNTVACPLHNWTVALTDGCAREPDEGCTPSFQVKRDGGDVFLLQVELDTLALDLMPPVAGPRISTSTA